MFDMLGTPDEHKRLVLLDGGHVPASPNAVIRAVLDWLDRYLGPVDRRHERSAIIRAGKNGGTSC